MFEWLSPGHTGVRAEIHRANCQAWSNMGLSFVPYLPPARPWAKLWGYRTQPVPNKGKLLVSSCPMFLSISLSHFLFLALSLSSPSLLLWNSPHLSLLLATVLRWDSMRKLVCCLGCLFVTYWAFIGRRFLETVPEPIWATLTGRNFRHWGKKVRDKLEAGFTAPSNNSRGVQAEAWFHHNW